MTTTRAVAKALRSEGHSVTVGAEPWGTTRNFQIYGRAGEAVVLNCQAASVLGLGCIKHPDYVKVRDALTETARLLLKRAGIPFTEGSCPDQLFLSGYVASGLK